jgi:alkylation response protein AidB-like acyl-CoA dehydrogenase
VTRDRIAHSSVVEETDEQSALRAAVGELAGTYGREYWQKVARAGAKPVELWTDLGAAGYLGVHLPEPYGGGAGLRELCVVIEEVAAHGCPMMLAVSSLSIAGTILNAHGSDVLKQRWLGRIADGSAIVVFAITEPDAGTNTHRITTTATPVAGGGWRLSGAKYWTTGVDEAQAILVVAKDAEPGPNGRSTLSLFVVDADAPGITKRPLDSALSGPEKSFMVFFDDVPIAPDSLVGAQGEGLKQVFAGLNPERIAAASLGNGIARYAIDRGVAYASQRVVWSTPIGAHQGVAHPLAKAYVDVQLARLMTARAADLYDCGEDPGEAANIAKLVAAEGALSALDQAIQVHGGNGLSTEFGLADLWFTARMLRTAPVSREMVLNHIAQHSLGLPKSY